MATVPVFVGLDYHSKSVQVCVMDRKGRVLVNRRCGNSVVEIAAAVGSGRAVQRAAIEACCGAADLAQALIDEVGWSVSLAHPGFVSRMKQNPDKTDYGDARMLAELVRVGMLPEVWLAPLRINELRLLVRLRDDLTRSLRGCKTRILAVLRQQRIAEPASANRWTRKWMRWLEGADCELSDQGRFVVGLLLKQLSGFLQQRRAVEQQLEQLTRDDPVVSKLLTIKGIGPVTAWTMRALIGRFDRFANGKQLARFCAVTPRNASSGERVADSGMVKAGDPLLKTVVIEAAQRLRRYEPRWQKFSEKLAERGKPASVIVGAIANRWVRGLHHDMKALPQAA